MDKFILIIIIFIINLNLNEGLKINRLLIKEFSPIKREVKKIININEIENKDKEVIKKVNGFYGLIGPSPKYYKKTDNYHLFDGNGMIQGVFIENNTITYTNHWVRTDKYNFENLFSTKLPLRMDNMFKKENLLKIPFFLLLEKLKLFPNFMGTANTALWESSKSDVNKEMKIIHALHERDKPYKIGINFKEKRIKTIGKESIKLDYFSAHPKIEDDIMYLCIYNTYLPEVKLLKLDENMNILSEKKIKMEYINMIHDISITKNKIIIFDTPFNFDLNELKEDRPPFYFNNSKKNRILIIDKDFNSIEKIECNESFFIFHNNKIEEDNKNIYIDVIIHKDFDLMLDSFVENINSKYRKLVINKYSLEYKIEKYEELEEYNVEFPINNNDYTVLCVFGKHLKIEGYLILKEGNIVKKNFLENRLIYGEPAINENNCLIYYSYDNNYNNYLNIYDIEEDRLLEYKLDTKLIKGFHSIFVNIPK